MLFKQGDLVVFNQPKLWAKNTSFKVKFNFELNEWEYCQVNDLSISYVDVGEYAFCSFLVLGSYYSKVVILCGENAVHVSQEYLKLIKT